MPKKLIWSVGVAAALVVAIIASVTLLTPPVLTQTADSKPATTAQVADVETTAYAMVSIDINPSFELYLDEAGNVIEIEPVNQDAAQLRKEEKVAFQAMIGQPSDDVVAAIIDLAKKHEYIKSGDSTTDYVLVSSVILDEEDPDAEANQDSIGAKIKAKLSVPGALDDTTKVEIIKATLREKFAADEKDIPLGLYIIKGMYTGPERDEPIKVSEFVKNKADLAKLEQRAERVETRQEAKETRESEKAVTKESRKAERGTDETEAVADEGTSGRPENPGSQGKGRQ